jgi:hypothetical protein
MSLLPPRTQAIAIAYFPYFKWTVYTLLVINIALFYFVRHNTSAALDDFAWLILVAVFEIETVTLDEIQSNKIKKYLLIFLNIVGYLLIVVATIEYCSPEYIAQEGTLDIWNSFTWLILIAILQYDVYYPGSYSRLEWLIRNSLKIVLYIALIVYTILWGVDDGKFVDFWDAFLWILAFFTIEMNILESDSLVVER